MNSKKKNEISNRMELLASNLRDEMRLTNVDRISLTQIMRDKNILGVFLSLDENFSGMAVKTTDENNHSMYFMLINNKQSFAKQRFTGCHELYHLLYQEDFQVSSNNAGKYSDIDENEYSADVFAAYLLLPTMGLRKLVPIEEQQQDKIQLNTILMLEHKFGCSRRTLLVRLKELGWITSESYDKYSKDIIKGALRLGYTKELYVPTNINKIIGDYNEKAFRLYDQNKISARELASLLYDTQTNRDLSVEDSKYDQLFN